MRKPLGKQSYRGDLPLPFRQAVQIDNVVYLSGQLAHNAEGKIVGRSIEEQTRRCFENIESVLAQCGVGLADIFKVTAWLTDANDFTGFNVAFKESLAGNLPVRSTVVSKLVAVGALVELEVAAYMGD